MACEKGLFMIKSEDNSSIVPFSSHMVNTCVWSVCFIKDNTVLIGIDRPPRKQIFDYKLNKLIA
jgi:hypothetical protein